MTEIEAKVCMKQGFFVEVKGSIYSIIETLSGKKFTITQISEYLNPFDKTFIYSATLSNNGRACYNVELSKIEIIPELTPVLESYVERMQQARLKASLKQMLAAGLNKTQIKTEIGKLIDSIRKENKEDDGITAESD